MPRMIGSGLSRREREILDVLYRKGSATVGEVGEDLTDAPSYSAVRTILRILEAKGHIRHVEDGKRYVYIPLEPRKAAARSALMQVVTTFFAGSLEQAVTSFLSDADMRISDDELSRLSAAIDAARLREATAVDNSEQPEDAGGGGIR
jgi:predicted transcriptional regulator